MKETFVDSLPLLLKETFEKNTENQYIVDALA